VARFDHPGPVFADTIALPSGTHHFAFAYVTPLNRHDRVRCQVTRDTSGHPQDRGAGSRPPRVYLHLGEPKTGTTFLQHALWGNRARLAEQGILLPGYTRRDHSRASRDLRGTVRMPGDPVDPWQGEWDVLALQAMKAPVAAIISDELLGNCRQELADRAVRSLEAAELHIVLTVRDFGTLLPAEWQEAVKCRRTVRWEEWLGDVSRLGQAPDRHTISGFWAAHDTLGTLSRWSQHLPPDRIHVITMPRDGSPDELWHRFASVAGIDSAKIDLSQARGNTSLGLAETEFLRRMNETISDDMPDWYYTRYIKQILAHDVLTNQPRRTRLTLPPDRQDWARREAETLVAALRDAKYDIAGDLGELLPRPAGASTGAAAAYVPPDQQPADQLLAVALHATAVLAESRYREMYQPPEKQRTRLRPRMLASQLRWNMLNGPWVRRALRSRSGSPAVRRLRAAIWWVLMRPKGHRHIVAPAGQHDVAAPSAAWLAGARPGITGVQVPAQAGSPAEISGADPRT
jgi:hypothetical protein